MGRAVCLPASLTMKPISIAKLVNAAAAGPNKRYWRFYCSAVQSGTTMVIQEIELRISIGGSDILTPSTPVVASSEYSTYVAAHLVDGNLTNDQDVWATVGSLPQWAYFDTGGNTEVLQGVVYPQNNSGTVATVAPMDFVWAWSPDFTTWTDVNTQTGITGWTAGTPKVFTF